MAASDVRYARIAFSDPILDEDVSARLAAYEKYGGRIHYAGLSEKGTVTALLQLHGDDDATEELRDAIERHPRRVTYTFDVDDDIRLYIKFEPVEWTRQLHEVFRDYELAVDWPMVPTGDAGLRFTVLGQEPELKDALGTLEANWDLSLEGIGDYHGADRSAFPALTPHRRVILEEAVSQGYYDTPRRATQADLAATFDVSTATISEHLRKIESEVFRAMVG